MARVATDSPMTRDAVAAGDGAFSTCTAARCLAEHEVIEQRPIARDRLRVNAGRIRQEIGVGDARHKTAERTREARAC